jgi:hypothetical protein
MLTILASFFYIIDGGMILHRLKRRTAKIKIDFFTIGSRNQLFGCQHRDRSRAFSP